jgi:hypothetical protein
MLTILFAMLPPIFLLWAWSEWQPKQDRAAWYDYAAVGAFVSAIIGACGIGLTLLLLWTDVKLPRILAGAIIGGALCSVVAVPGSFFASGKSHLFILLAALSSTLAYLFLLTFFT